MPTYEYRCAKCGQHVEVYQSFSEDPLTKHDECGGKLTKVLISAPPQEQWQPGPLRRSIAESNKQDMTDYAKEAVGLVKLYLPPDPAKIQKVKDAGGLSVSPLPDQDIRLTFANYIKAGDSLSLVMNPANNSLLSAKVDSTMDSDGEPVTLDVKFAVVDKAIYTAQIVLDATGKDLEVKVVNSGYHKVTP